MARFNTGIKTMLPTIRRFLLVITVASLVGILIFAYLHFSENGYFAAFSETPSGFVSSGAIGAIVGLLLYFSNRLLDQWIPWRKNFAARFTLGYLTSTILAFVATFGLAAVFVSMKGEDFFWEGYSPYDDDMNIKVGILLAATIFIYTIIYALLYSYQQYAVAQLEHLQQERKQTELQFEALKSQLSPHYLFNSLNTISSLIYKDTPSAEQFVRRLAQTYQYILSTQHRRYVSVQEEVDFVQSYYYLLRIRFQQQLSLEVNLPASVLRSRIPPLTLQILVENAVKHNVLHQQEEKLFIYISAQDNTYLRIINTKSKSNGPVHSFRLGLENIRKRYEFFTDKKIVVRDDEKFTVALPVLADASDAKGDGSSDRESRRFTYANASLS
ncbi:histidine kinase [Chryseolinea sp. T2]|uniref:sensor histidine kinase n=1 Tax=Chryseolinea sp. T2 TaxID=3129255 RepID=UPI003076E127